MNRRDAPEVRAAAPVRAAVGDRPLAVPSTAQRRQVLFLGVLILAMAVTSTLAALASPATDEWLHQQVAARSGVPALDLPAAARPGILAGLALILLVGLRCRGFGLLTVSTLAVGVAAGQVVSVVVERVRPVEAYAGDTGGYPVLSLLILTALAGLVLPALDSARDLVPGRRWIAGLCAGLVGVSALAEVAARERRPLDVLGALLFGGTLAVVVRILLERPAGHGRCRECPWLRRARVAEPATAAIDLTGQDRVRLVHRVAMLWVAGLWLSYALLALTRGLPRSAESGAMGTGLEVPLQWGLLALITIGIVVARQWHVPGAVVVAVGAALLGYVSSVEYAPAVAVTIAALAWVPALLLWLEWHRRTSLRAALAGAVITAVVLSTVVGAAANTYASYWGPTHPRSATAAPATDVLEWMWSGAVTSTGAEVRLRTRHRASVVELLIGTDQELAAARVAARARPDADRVANLPVAGLRPGVRYFYAARVDGQLVRTRVQSFRTFPQGAAGFSFVVGSCQLGGSNGRVFDTMRALDPLFVLATGDWTYANIDTDDPARFRAQYALNLQAPAQAALYARAPIGYVWDDHDYGGNDADRTSAARPAAISTYRQMVPHYRLAADPAAPIYQAFTVGRVRFLVTDTRSARDPAGAWSGAFRSTLGAQQRAWLLREIAAADEYALVVWVSPDPWVDEAGPDKDTWGGFAHERRLIADSLAAHRVRNLLMVSGDAHMLGYDDGTHTDYSSNGFGGFPLLQAAAVDRPGSVKGGPYSGPVLPGGGQFAAVDVRDGGTRISATLTGWRWDARRLFTRTVSFPVAKQ